MKNLIIALSLIFIGCSENPKEPKEVQCDLSDEPVQIEYSLLDTIKATIKTMYGIDSLGIKSHSDLGQFYGVREVYDYNKIKSFHSNVRFSFVEFNSEVDAKAAFDKVKSAAIALNERREWPIDYEYYFSKGGITYTLFDNWMIEHFLRCNMTEDEHKKDMNLAESLSLIGNQSDWLKGLCGGVKVKLNPQEIE